MHPRIGAALLKGFAANQTCGSHYVSCGGVAPSALGPGAIGKPPKRGVSIRWDSAPTFGAGKNAAPLWLVGGRKDACPLRVLAVSCECRRTPFPGAEYDLSTQKRVGKQLRFPTLFLCSAGVVADAPSGTLSHALLGPAPDPAKGYRALGWAECASRLDLPLCSAPPLRYLFSCTPLLAAALGAGARPCRFAVWFTALFGPAASLSCFLHSVACGGVAPPALGPGARPCRPCLIAPLSVCRLSQLLHCLPLLSSARPVLSQVPVCRSSG